VAVLRALWLGYLYGNGGPMQTIGYMDGFMKVVA
jgi:hypothetical protein